MNDVCFSSDSQMIGFGCSNGQIGIVRVKDKKAEAVKSRHAGDAPIHTVAFNSNDTCLASASLNGLLCVTKVSGSESTTT